MTAPRSLGYAAGLIRNSPESTLLPPFPVITAPAICRAILASACIALAACGGKSSSGPPAQPGQAAQQGGPPRGGPPGAGAPGGPGRSAAVAVLATKVAPRDFMDRTTALGTARAAESIEVTSRISSTVSEIRFREGQDVAAGALLVQLDNREISAALALAEASLRQSRSQYERSLPLAKTGVLSASQIEELEAKMKMDQAQAQSARARLADTSIRAPFAGTVGLRRISVGDLVGPDTVITTLDDTREIRLEFTVPEIFLGEVSAGMTIRARSNVYPDRDFTGRVSSIDSRVDPVTRAITVVAGIPNDDRRLKPGMFLTVALERSRKGVLMVPEEALSPRQGKQYVYLVQQGRALERQVEIGARSPGLVEIREGLVAGDVIVTEGIQRLRDGLPVEVLQGG
ncbi:MAG: efflux RND transporter periplasmic adaptor subunit [Proteobacteria bacterium]|nr:MAG: efflux RND transporter periplasmic adaptor subunit [Pseudomonadota bacterium]MBC6945660.1 efflux RND transporter periplasmic adaptor subunit [Gammaproteobacteria bacterium]MCE7896335.1 efflux RND transporter periplasmic adaptor subunit [Gammaproteobacteria bacterium PRO8]MCQ3933554.1 efflux transporter periplasmic adaptor subunit [Gammaproteobacteria bacterium]MDL1881880.1 efflux RND transporter periplasmic adaptor subunit [Gammaproteobacteria bacterium PRO2]